MIGSSWVEGRPDTLLSQHLQIYQDIHMGYVSSHLQVVAVGRAHHPWTSLLLWKPSEITNIYQKVKFCYSKPLISQS